MSTDLSQFGGMSLPQKLELVEALWDEIAVSNESLPIPAWQEEELDRREQQEPSAGIPWAEAKRRILKGDDN